MKTYASLGAAALALTICGTVEATEKGFEMGLRSGYALPIGGGSGDAKLSNGVSGLVPLWLDVGYRITPNVMLGGYFQYGLGIVASDTNSDCDLTGVDCSVSNVRLGVQTHYHFLPWEAVDPWLGAGIGYEWLSVSFTGVVRGQQYDGSGTLHGFEFINVQGGVDFRPSDKAHFSLGPFIALSVGELTSCSASEGYTCTRRASGVHEWFTLGVRGTFVP